MLHDFVFSISKRDSEEKVNDQRRWCFRHFSWLKQLGISHYCTVTFNTRLSKERDKTQNLHILHFALRVFPIRA